MTTKSKTRKPAAKTAAPKQAPKQDFPEEAENEIRKLIARWNYLEADRKYQAALAPSKWESDFCLRLHEKEKDEIKTKLATLVPNDFGEVYAFFDFAIAAILAKVERREVAQTEIKMLTTLRQGISLAKAEEWARLTIRGAERELAARRRLAEALELQP
jgi:hypothetical protein